MTLPTDVVIRRADADDMPFVLSTWTLGEFPWRGNKETGARRQSRDKARASAALILERASVVVACAREHPSTIYGWACAHLGTLLHVYVSHDTGEGQFMRAVRGDDARNSDIGKALIQEVHA